MRTFLLVIARETRIHTNRRFAIAAKRCQNTTLKLHAAHRFCIVNGRKQRGNAVVINARFNTNSALTCSGNHFLNRQIRRNMRSQADALKPRSSQNGTVIAFAVSFLDTRVNVAAHIKRLHLGKSRTQLSAAPQRARTKPRTCGNACKAAAMRQTGPAHQHVASVRTLRHSKNV